MFKGKLVNFSSIILAIGIFIAIGIPLKDLNKVNRLSNNNPQTFPISDKFEYTIKNLAKFTKYQIIDETSNLTLIQKEKVLSELAFNLDYLNFEKKLNKNDTNWELFNYQNQKKELRNFAISEFGVLAVRNLDKFIPVGHINLKSFKELKNNLLGFTASKISFSKNKNRSLTIRAESFAKLHQNLSIVTCNIKKNKKITCKRVGILIPEQLSI